MLTGGSRQTLYVHSSNLFAEGRVPGRTVSGSSLFRYVTSMTDCSATFAQAGCEDDSVGNNDDGEE